MVRAFGALALLTATACYQSHEVGGPEPPIERCEPSRPDVLSTIEAYRAAAERARLDEDDPIVTTPRTGELVVVDGPRLEVFMDEMPWDETVNLQPPRSSRHGTLFRPHVGELATVQIDDGWHRLDTETTPMAFIAVRALGPERPGVLRSPFTDLELELVPTCTHPIEECPTGYGTSFGLIASLPSGETVTVEPGATRFLGTESIHHAFSLEAPAACGAEPELRAVVVLYGER